MLERSGKARATHQMHDDLAVRVRLELGGLLERGAEGEVVVNLAVDAEGNLAVVRDERLGTGVCMARREATRSVRDQEMEEQENGDAGRLVESEPRSPRRGQRDRPGESPALATLELIRP